MATYIIDLPQRLPNELFRNLECETDANFREEYHGKYRELPKRAVTSRAGSPRDALGHLLFRNFCKKDSLVLLKMLRNIAPQCAFEVPEIDSKDSNPRLCQEVELTEDIANSRGINQTKAYFLARDLMDFYRKS